VPRDEFDAMMLDNAAEQGVTVRQGLHVSDVLFDGTQATGVVTRAQTGVEQTIGASVVVDATGQGALLARKLDLKRPDARLRKASVFAHYRGAHRDSGIDEGATLIVYTPSGKGWFWYIPLPDDRVSVGVVGDPEELFGSDRAAPAAVLDREIAACPAVAERLTRATRQTDVHVLRDFSYRLDRLAGDGWVLVGDAGGFIDPIYSSGVFLALKSGEFAADAIDDALEAGDLSGARLGVFQETLAFGVAAVRKLVYAFYARGFSFADFLAEHPEHRDNLVALLVGDVFRKEVHEIFTPMARMCDLGEPVST
jgi:flavin-dependent dehydrogenase